jgi:hypothetical protein
VIASHGSEASVSPVVPPVSPPSALPVAVFFCFFSFFFTCDSDGSGGSGGSGSGSGGIGISGRDDGGGERAELSLEGGSVGGLGEDDDEVAPGHAPAGSPALEQPVRQHRHHGARVYPLVEAVRCWVVPTHVPAKWPFVRE